MRRFFSKMLVVIVLTVSMFCLFAVPMSAQEVDSNKNLLLDAEVEANSAVNDSFVAEFAVDGDLESAWSSARLPDELEGVLEDEEQYQWFIVTLESEQFVDKIVIYPRNNIGTTFATEFTVEVSPSLKESDYKIIATEKEYLSDGINAYVINFENTEKVRTIKFTGKAVRPEVEGHPVCYIQISEFEAYYTGAGAPYVEPEKTATPPTVVPSPSVAPSTPATVVGTDKDSLDIGTTGGSIGKVAILPIIGVVVVVIGGMIFFIAKKKK